MVISRRDAGAPSRASRSDLSALSVPGRATLRGAVRSWTPVASFRRDANGSAEPRPTTLRILTAYRFASQLSASLVGRRSAEPFVRGLLTPLFAETRTARRSLALPRFASRFPLGVLASQLSALSSQLSPKPPNFRLASRGNVWLAGRAFRS